MCELARHIEHCHGLGGRDPVEIRMSYYELELVWCLYTFLSHLNLIYMTCWILVAGRIYGPADGHL